MLWLLMRIRRWTAGGRPTPTLPRVLQDLGNTPNSRGSSNKGFRVIRPPSGGDQTGVLVVEQQQDPSLQFPLSLTPPHDSPSNSPRPSPQPSSRQSPRSSILFAYSPPPQSTPHSSPGPQQDSWNSRWDVDTDGMPTRPPPPIPNYVPQGGRNGNESPSFDHPRTLLSREPFNHLDQSARSSPYMNEDYPTNTDGPIEETH